jgi:hypothetical protein
VRTVTPDDVEVRPASFDGSLDGCLDDCLDLVVTGRVRP